MQRAGMTYGDNFEDRMTTAGAVTMVYDGDSHRVSRTAGGVTTRFLVDDLTPTGYAQVAEELVSGAVTVRYTHGIQRISQSRAGVTHFYGYDGGGSVRQVTDASGAVTDTYTFDGFGVLIGGTGSTVNAYRYRGEQWDASVGMYYLRARWYEPSKGRFWTADKWEPDSDEPIRLRQVAQVPIGLILNSYAYTEGNPVDHLDPSGNRLIETGLFATADLQTALGAWRAGTYARCVFALEILLLKLAVSDPDFLTGVAGGTLVWSCGAAFHLWP